MIILEGPDGSGKTTLARQLSGVTGLEIAPRVVSKDAEAQVDLVKWVDNNLKRGFHDTIYDRHRLISEPIYGPMLRPESEPMFDNFHWLSSQLLRFYRIGPVIIYCLPPFGAVWESVRSDPDNKVVHDIRTARAIYNLYVTRASLDYTRIGTRVMIYTWVKDGHTLLNLADYINSTIKEEDNVHKL